MSGGVRLGLDSMHVVSDGGLESPFLRENHSQTEVSIRLVWKNSQDFLKMRLSFIQLSAICEDAAKNTMSDVVVFCDGDCMSEQSLTVSPCFHLHRGQRYSGRYHHDAD